jgi:hypothetical protein
MAARTLDSDLGADTHYFNEAGSYWWATFRWPVGSGSIITHGTGWTRPSLATEIDVDYVPTQIDLNPNFAQFIPQP